MEATLQITIEDLPKETQTAIISAAEFWQVTPAEAVRRIINSYLGKMTEAPTTQPA